MAHYSTLIDTQTMPNLAEIISIRIMDTQRSVTTVTVYDKAKYHFLGQFPSDLPMEQAYVHIGMFLGWATQQHLYSEFFEDEEGHQIIRFLRREITCSILSALWDGCLDESVFNEEANAFAKQYYSGGQYLKDYEMVLAQGLPSIYHVQDSWENFDKISSKISEQFQNWKSSQ